ncbi:hypothetical protein O181_082631 [Austropuccinia psidii MF-1]|uniref:Uncharacterized protein n=1 Tax=Austropuccinia psidii MF-1 TaxID=1389203 RepID=A0A9Q3FSZ6_9BASI|nr:hypothetical protein [Austropuccinia psidii MF-1]
MTPVTAPSRSSIWGPIQKGRTSFSILGRSLFHGAGLLPEILGHMGQTGPLETPSNLGLGGPQLPPQTMVYRQWLTDCRLKKTPIDPKWPQKPQIQKNSIEWQGQKYS